MSAGDPALTLHLHLKKEEDITALPQAQNAPAVTHKLAAGISRQHKPAAGAERARSGSDA